MVAKTDVMTAAHEIEEALWAFLRPTAVTPKVWVFQNESGYLRALIGSGGFGGMPLGERIQRVWAFLEAKVSDEHLRYLSGVHPMDLEEYDARVAEA
jgi:hypothetical protein